MKISKSICHSTTMVALGAVLVMVACSPAGEETEERDTKAIAPATAIDGQALYLTHCSGCHGKAGDGKGETELKRPARSFAAGGFAFGNTPEALFKTITSGLPGISEMPSFAEKMNDDERRAVVAHVRTLIPEQKQVDDTATIMLVDDKPRIFRGILPPLRKGLPIRPRGLLIGLPGGTTFEYRIDDPRLLAVRTGGFVKRTDWTGRGGTAAKPTGQIRFTFDGGNPGPLFHYLTTKGLVPTQLKMKGSFAFDGLAGISYEVPPHGSSKAITVKEAPFAQAFEDAFGFGRRFLIGPSASDLVLKFDSGSKGSSWVGLNAEAGDHDPQFPSAPLLAQKPVVRKNQDGSALVFAYQGMEGVRIGTKQGGLAIRVPASSRPRELAIVFIQIEKYSIDAIETLAAEVRW